MALPNIFIIILGQMCTCTCALLTVIVIHERLKCEYGIAALNTHEKKTLRAVFRDMVYIILNPRCYYRNWLCLAMKVYAI